MGANENERLYDGNPADVIRSYIRIVAYRRRLPTLFLLLLLLLLPNEYALRNHFVGTCIYLSLFFSLFWFGVNGSRAGAIRSAAPYNVP